MILQALYQYYERLKEDPAEEIALPGFSSEPIGFVIRLERDGRMFDVADLREARGKMLVRRNLIVPKPPQKRTSAITPYFVWDKSDYVLGYTIDENGNVVLRPEHFKRFKNLAREVRGKSSDEGIDAVIRFVESWDPEQATNLEYWQEIAANPVVFQLDGDREFVHERPVVREMWLNYFLTTSNAKAVEGMCLVTGTQGRIARLHPPISGVKNAHTAGAGIVTFNKDKTAFTSYGKEQNFNAPVRTDIAFAYATALNHLLARDSTQKIQIADATTVFWTERDSPVEGMLGMILDPNETQIADNAKLRQLLQAMLDGRRLEEMDPDVKFFILGLAENGPRISVRFWHVCSVGELEDRIGRHFRDLQLQRISDSVPAYPGIRRILRETYNKKSKKETASPLLAGTLMRCILEGTAYPQALQNAVINRIRAEQALKDKKGRSVDNVNYVRAAILKAILVRKFRIYNQGMEVKMSLDKENKNPAYLLGRLFAVLEKAQKDALDKNINATIKDRFFGSASATPKTVFPQLLRLSQHHIKKAERGHVNDKRIEEILCDIKEFPAYLSLDEQSMFILGYYHQRQDF